MAGFLTFGSAILSSSQVQGFLMDQAVISVANAAGRPTPSHEGMTAYERDVNSYVTYDGSNWVTALLTGQWFSWSPTVTQSVGVGVTNNYSRYMRAGRLILAITNLTMGTDGTATNDIVIGNLPVAAATSSGIFGVFYLLDVGNTIYTGSAVGSSTTAVKMYVSGNGTPLGTTPNIGLVANDVLAAAFFYEAAA